MRPRLLVVDDDPSVREALAAALADTYLVRGAATGDETYRTLQAHPIRAIILDAILENEHGLDLVDRFRTLSHAPILLLTGHSTEELAIGTARAHVDYYLKKPPNIEELRARLAKVVPQGAQGQEDPVARARHTLVAHAEGQATTAALAREVGMSERHLRRRFRQVQGKSPRRYLTELRLQRAAELLLTTQWGVEAVALEVGCGSVRAFDRSFKTYFGVPPSAFRISHRGHR